MKKGEGGKGGQRGGAIPDYVAPFLRNFRVFSKIYLISNQKGEERKGSRWRGKWRGREVGEES